MSNLNVNYKHHLYVFVSHDSSSFESLSRFSRLSLSTGATAHPDDPRSGVDEVMHRLSCLVTVDGAIAIANIASEQSNGDASVGYGV